MSDEPSCEKCGTPVYKSDEMHSPGLELRRAKQAMVNAASEIADAAERLIRKKPVQRSFIKSMIVAANALTIFAGVSDRWSIMRDFKGIKHHGD